MYVVTLLTLSVASSMVEAMNPKIMSSEGNLLLNSFNETGQVLINGVDALSKLAENTESISLLETSVTAQASTSTDAATAIASLNATVSTQASRFQQANILITNQASALSSQATALSTAESTIAALARDLSTATASLTSIIDTFAAPPPPLTGTSAANTDVSCAVIWQKRSTAGQSVPDGYYWIDTDGTGSRSPARVVCDMINGGFNVVNSAATVNVASRHATTRRTYSVSTFGYSTSQYRFEEVEAEIKFAGELDDTNNYLDTWFNTIYVSRYKSSLCTTSAQPVAGWPRVETIRATQFYLQTKPSGDVDQRCGSIPTHGRNYFYVRKIKVVPV